MVLCAIGIGHTNDTTLLTCVDTSMVTWRIFGQRDMHEESLDRQMDRWIDRDTERWMDINA